MEEPSKESMELVEAEIGRLLQTERRAVRRALSIVEEKTNYTTRPSEERALVRNTIMGGYAELYNAFMLLLRKLGYPAAVLDRRWQGNGRAEA